MSASRKLNIGLLTLEVPGHLNPVCALGVALRRRGHRVGLIGSARVKDFAWRFGLAWHPTGTDETYRAAPPGRMRRVSSTRRFRRWQAIRAFGRQLETTLKRDLPAAIDEHELDGLVIDQTCAAGIHIAERLNIDFVVASPALAALWPPFDAPSIRPHRGPVRRHLRQWTYERLLPEVDRLLFRRPERSILRGMIENDRGLAWVAQQPPWFEVAADRAPDHLHLTGPWFRDAMLDKPGEFDVDQLDDRPVVYASMGTLFNRHPAMLRTILRAARDPGAQFVLSTGGADVALPASLPPHVYATRFVPLEAMLDRADVMVSHAGVNSVLEALAHATPLVCLPMAFDQPAVARYVEALGAGARLDPHRVDPAQLRSAIQRILDDASHHRAAQRLAAKLAERAGATVAAEVIERALTTGERVIAGRPMVRAAHAGIMSP